MTQSRNKDARQFERVIKIESNVPPPPSAARKPLFYDVFESMKVGDSFHIPGYAGGLKKQREQVAGAASRYRLIYAPDFYTTCRIENGGIRCWRITKPFNFDKYQARAKAANAARAKQRAKDAKEHGEVEA